MRNEGFTGCAMFEQLDPFNSQGQTLRRSRLLRACALGRNEEQVYKEPKERAVYRYCYFCGEATNREFCSRECKIVWFANANLKNRCYGPFELLGKPSREVIKMMAFRPLRQARSPKPKETLRRDHKAPRAEKLKPEKHSNPKLIRDVFRAAHNPEDISPCDIDLAMQTNEKVVLFTEFSCKLTNMRAPQEIWDIAQQKYLEVLSNTSIDVRNAPHRANVIQWFDDLKSFAPAQTAPHDIQHKQTGDSSS